MKYEGVDFFRRVTWREVIKKDSTLDDVVGVGLAYWRILNEMEMEIERKMINHKGERCQFDDNVFCQEGFCEDCAIGEKYQKEFVEK